MFFYLVIKMLADDIRNLAHMHSIEHSFWMTG